MDKLAAECEGMSGAEIALVCREAGLLSLSEDNSIENLEAANIQVKGSHLSAAARDVKARGKQPSKGLF